MSQIEKALEQACRIFPYLPYVLRRVDIEARSGAKSFMKWTKDGTISINIDPMQADTPEKFEFVLLHEVGHIIYVAHLFKDDQRWEESRDLVNIAMDLIINETIIDFDSTYRNTVKDMGVWSFEVVKQRYGIDLNLRMTWVEIYDALKPHVKFNNVANLVDAHTDEDGDTPKEIVDSLLDNPGIAASVKGLNLPDITFKKTQKLKHDKFKMELSKFIGSLVAYDKKATVMRPNRRSQDAVKGSRKDKKVNALIAVDVSGSITSYLKELQTSFSVVFNYCDSVDVLPFNHEVGSVIKSVTRMPEFTPGGGTNFQILHPFPSNYDVMIVISDMECDPPTFKDDNVIYISNNTPEWVKDKRYVLL